MWGTARSTLRHLASEQWARDGGRYIPHPTTWLNGERWNDDAGPKAKVASSKYANV